MGRRRKKWFWYVLWIGLLLLIVAGGFALRIRGNRQKAPSLPSAEVKLDDFVDYLEMRGEIAVRSSRVIAAPNNAGDLQILKLARNGSEVQQGDVVVEFDPTPLQRNAEQARFSLKSVEQEIARAKAQQNLTEEQIKTELMSAEFTLQRARLDASTGDVVPALEHQKNILALEKAEQKLRELNTRMESRRVGLEADLAGILRKREKAQADIEQAERNMAALTLISPGDGIITLLPNSRARTSIISSSAPVFKEGDRAYAGAAIAEIPDLSTIQANAPVTEADRGRVQVGQPVILAIEAVPDKEHKGHVKEISALAKVDYSNLIASKNFDMVVELDNPDPRLRPGMTVGFRVEVERVPKSVVIPSEAVFSKRGQVVAYVLAEGVYRERPLTLARRGTGQVMVSRGLKPGEKVALKDPTEEEK